MVSHDGRVGTAAYWSRRHYLAASVGLAALSGCTGDSDEGQPPTATETATESETEGVGEEELPEGVSEDEFVHGPVPDVYLSATSIAGETRNPDELQMKGEVTFSEYDEATENASHEPGRCCANCSEFIHDMNGDTFGACAKVEGYIDGADWCAIYEALPEPSIPDGMSQSELATADVPGEYRTADSQGGEARTPDNLSPQSDVNLGESVERIAGGMAQPGQSCGNCAEFIPDKNGDGWGACAKVDGYIAVEDWCSVFEPVSEVL